MASTDTQRGRAPAHLSLTVAAWLALLAAMLPLAGVLAPGPWTAGVLVSTGAVFGTGFACRWRRLPIAAVALVELAVWIVLVTAMFLRETAVAFVVPTLRTLDETQTMVRAALFQIQTGTAPLAVGPELAFLVVASAGLVAVITDHVAITARMPLAAAVGLLSVSLIPSLAVPAGFDVAGFVLLACAVLFLLRAETRTRYQPPQAAPTPPGSTSAIAVAIGLVAVLVAVTMTPLLPEPASRAAAGGGTTIDASLDLGRDLRRPDPITVLTVRTSAVSAPYLRVATLSVLSGTIWKPDRFPGKPLQSAAGFGASPVAAGVSTQKVTTTITVQGLTSQYLPVPFPPVKVEGVDGGWEAMAANGTVVGDDALTQPGLEYTVTSRVPQPTLEQIRAAVAVGSRTDDRELPHRLPAIIAQDARAVTVGTTNDYDALIALQEWFRGPEFAYSLTAPVRNGYDGSGVSSVAAFLQAKSGYCVHFASAFAIMARVLGMPSRIVVGYLPGLSNTSNVTSGPQTYAVSSTELHAWPEVYFSRIGWIAFDPTKGLGEATAFLPALTGVGGPDASAPTPEPSGPGAALRQNAGGVTLDESDGTTTAVVPAPSPVPWEMGAAALVLLLLAPGLVGAFRRRRRDAAAAGGDPFAAWAGVREAAIDLGIPVPAAESPRAFGARLVCAHGAPQHETMLLVAAVEAAAYAADGSAAPDAAATVAARAMRTALYLAVPARTRVRALLFPRSLLVRPGSLYAGAGASTATR